jgi:Domain of unknown function (DUF4189)
MGARRHHVAFGAALLAAAVFAAGGDADAQTRRTHYAYGAIAYHRSTDSVGYAYDYPTERAASVAALNQCGQPTCSIVIAFRNACGAVAIAPSKKQPSGGRGVTAQEAESRALKACGVDACHIVAWACTR